MTTYRTFKRAATNWQEFANAPKEQMETGLTRDEAVDACRAYNENPTQDDIDAGTKLKFEEE